MALDTVIIQFSGESLRVEGIYIPKNYFLNSCNLPSASDFEIYAVYYKDLEITDILGEIDNMMYNSLIGEDFAKRVDMWEFMSRLAKNEYEKENNIKN